MFSRARSLSRVAAVATRAPVTSHVAGSNFRHFRSFSSSSTSSSSWEVLQAELGTPPGSQDPHAAIKALNTHELRVDAWPHPSGVATFWLLRHANSSVDGAKQFDPASELGQGANNDVLASVVQQDSILYGIKTRFPIPATAASRLVHAAVEKSNGPLTALVALPRLCQWARDGERWNDADVLQKSNGESVESAEAIALGRPREGHSVLGQGTFKAAEEAWMALAEKHMMADDLIFEEMMAYKQVMPGVFKPAHLADGDPEYLAVAGGAMAVLQST